MAKDRCLFLTYHNGLHQKEKLLTQAFYNCNIEEKKGTIYYLYLKLFLNKSKKSLAPGSIGLDSQFVERQHVNLEVIGSNPFLVDFTLSNPKSSLNI